jgi:tetratricopeptide (TPR) repeat protein
MNATWENHNERGGYYYRRGQYEQAIGDFSQVINLKPDHPWPWLNRCEMEIIVNRLADAISDCNRSLAVAAVPMALINRGTANLKIGEPRLAIADFEKASAQAGTDRFWDLLYPRGIAKRRIGDIAGGNADIAAAIALEPEAVGKWQKYGIKP